MIFREGYDAYEPTQEKIEKNIKRASVNLGELLSRIRVSDVDDSMMKIDHLKSDINKLYKQIADFFGEDVEEVGSERR